MEFCENSTSFVFFLQVLFIELGLDGAQCSHCLLFGADCSCWQFLRLAAEDGWLIINASAFLKVVVPQRHRCE